MRLPNRRVRSDANVAWLIAKITHVLPSSLGLATDLFQYWASTRHGIVSEQQRGLVRAALVESARASFQSADTLLLSLGPVHEYPLTRLVYPPPGEEPADTVSLDSWDWLVELIIQAAKVNEGRIVPDVAILVGDTTHGFRTGQFEERYRLKHDWMRQIFGARTEEMLHLLASSRGSNEYALHAKKEATQWLSELANPAIRTAPRTEKDLDDNSSENPE